MTDGRLEPAQLKSLLNVTTELFSSFNSLVVFVVLKMNIRLNVYVTDNGQGMQEIVHRMIEKFEELSLVEPLIVQIWLKKPSEDRLKQLAADLNIPLQETPPIPPGELAGLGAAVGGSATRAALIPYRKDIRNLCVNIAGLGAMKYLHDKVDHLRRTVLMQLPSVLARPEAPDTRDQLRALRTQLDVLVSDIRSKVAQAKLTDQDVPWIEESLLPAQDLMQKAAAGWPLPPPLVAARGFLEHVTGAKLSNINGQIKGRAQALAALNFPDRMAALQAEVAPQLDSEDDRAELAKDLARVIAAITNLADLVDEHDRWQRIKDYSRLLDAMMTRPVAESIYSWPTLDKLLGQVSTNALYPPPDGLVQGWRAVAAVFADPALDHAQPSRPLGDAVYTLSSFINDQFYVVDKNLLNECDFTAQIGDGLQKVMEKLDG